MEISISNPGFYFKLFYLLGFAFIFTMVIIHSLRRGYHLRSVLLMLTTITLFTIIGTRLFTIPIQDWATVLSSEATIYNDRSAVGGLIFGLIGLLISQRVFGFNRPLLDLYAWIAPVAFGIQKIGCFFNGCCYGNTSELFLVVQYPKGTHAHFNQWQAGVIDQDAAISLFVHPVQLYETLFLLGIGFVVYKTFHLWKKNASAILFSLLLFFTFRFFIEFFRDPMGSQFNLEGLFGVRKFQWALLMIGLFCGVILLCYEKYFKTEFIKGNQNSPYVHADLIYILTISVIIYTCNGLFSKYELFAVWMKFIPAILLILYYFLTDQRVRKYRFITSTLALVPLFVISQTVQKETPKIEKYKRVDFGGSFGSFFNEVNYNPQQGECGTSYTTEYYKNVYRIGGLGFSNVSIKNNTTTTTYGVNVHAGTVRTTNLSTNEEKSKFLFAANPYVQIEDKWFGIGIGFQAGDLRKYKNEQINSDNAADAQKSYNILPEFYFRVGLKKYLDLDYNYGFLFPSPYPSLYQRVSIGSGFGKSSNYSLRLGRFLPIDARFISAEGLISDQFGVNLMYIFKDTNGFQDQNLKGKFVFGLNYRFGHSNK